MIAVISASLGSFDKDGTHIKQSTPHDYFLFTDENFPPRTKALQPRLQAKIPKMFGWQLIPGYDYYMWLDGNIKFRHPEALNYFYEKIQDYDFVVLRHPKRPNIRQEQRYLRKGLREQSRYLCGRYENEWYIDQIDEIKSDPNFIDDTLVLGGVFMYRNTPGVQKMLKEWWYFTSRYTVFDQFSLVYLLKTSGLRVKILNDLITDHFDYHGHRYHSK